MNNLKKIVQMVVDYYNEVGCGDWEKHLLYVRLLCVHSVLVGVVVCIVYVAPIPGSQVYS